MKEKEINKVIDDLAYGFYIDYKHVESVVLLSRIESKKQ